MEAKRKWQRAYAQDDLHETTQAKKPYVLPALLHHGKVEALTGNFSTPPPPGCDPNRQVCSRPTL